MATIDVRVSDRFPGRNVHALPAPLPAVPGLLGVTVLNTWLAVCLMVVVLMFSTPAAAAEVDDADTDVY